jgi:hypothetical protein
MQFASSLCSQAAHVTITFATQNSDASLAPTTPLNMSLSITAYSVLKSETAVLQPTLGSPLITTAPFSTLSTPLWTSSPMFPASSLETPLSSATLSLSSTISRDTYNNSKTMSGLATSIPSNASATPVVFHGEGVLGILFSCPVVLCIMVIQALYW